MNTHHAFAFQSHTLWALAEGALWWPDERLLCVSDLHLGKSDRIARRTGAMLPPYETQDTLDRLGTLINTYDPTQVICLGDSFDDLDAALSLSDMHHRDVARLQAGRRWTWIEGNHDPGPIEIGGQHMAELTLDGLTFRHIAEPAAEGEISGHYHPKCRLSRGGSRPAFLISTDRIILPAFGTYTGGLRATDPALTRIIPQDATAILTGRKAMPVPFKATG